MNEPASPFLSNTKFDSGDPSVVDSAARHIGLRPVRAWVPDEHTANRTTATERTKRCRDKAQAQGLKQLSITVPLELHPLLKALAIHAKEGESMEIVLNKFLAEHSKIVVRTTKTPLEPRVSLHGITRWRRWLAWLASPFKPLRRLS
jgi:hypothetical protein